MLKIGNTELTPENWTTLVVPADMSPDAVQNLLGDTKKLAGWMKKMEDYLKEALQAKHPADELEWEYITPEPSHFSDILPPMKYRAARVERTRVSLDQDLIKADFPDEDAYNEWFKKHSKSTTYYELRMKELTPE